MSGGVGSVRGLGGPSPFAGPTGRRTYTVRKGDTLSGIAKRHGVSLRDLLRANPQIQDPNKIYPGQEIVIPDRPRAGGTPSPPRDTYEKAAPPSPFGTPTVRLLSASATNEVNKATPVTQSSASTTQLTPVTMAQMNAIIPGFAKRPGAQAILDALNDTMRRLGLTTPEQKAMFIAQTAYECEYYCKLEEDIPKSLPNLPPYWPYIGRGFIRLTGRSNYRDFTDWVHRYVTEKCPQDKATFEARIRQEVKDRYPTWVSDLKAEIARVEAKIAKIETLLQDPFMPSKEKIQLREEKIQWQRYLEAWKRRLAWGEKVLEAVKDLDLAKVDFTKAPYFELIGLSPTLASLATQYFWEASILGRPWENDPVKVSRAVNRGKPNAPQAALGEPERIKLYKKALEVLQTP